MSKLKCNDRECKHNCCYACKKQSIILDDDAICCSFQKKMNGSLNEEFANDQYFDFSDVETSINCNEDTCYFNKDNYCRASEVKIDADAWCSTYRRK